MGMAVVRVMEGNRDQDLERVKDGASEERERENRQIVLNTDRFEVLREMVVATQKFHLGGFLWVCNKTLTQ